MDIDYISDLHVDHWVDGIGYPLTDKGELYEIQDIIEGMLPEKGPASVLIIGGDLGNNNDQNKKLLKLFRNYYEQVFWVHGNHDLWVCPGRRGWYQGDSFARLQDMITFSLETDGVTFLDGRTIHDIGGGITIGGSGAFYDGSYGKFVMGLSEKAVRGAWEGFADSQLIYIEGDTPFEPFVYAKEQATLLAEIAPKCTVMVSHVPPLWNLPVPEKFQNLWGSFFSFNGTNILRSMQDGSAWVFGHTHLDFDLKHEQRVRLLCNPLGYPFERKPGVQIKTLTV